jgi:hypothetical protein
MLIFHISISAFADLPGFIGCYRDKFGESINYIPYNETERNMNVTECIKSCKYGRFIYTGTKVMKNIDNIYLCKVIPCKLYGIILKNSNSTSFTHDQFYQGRIRWWLNNQASFSYISINIISSTFQKQTSINMCRHTNYHAKYKNKTRDTFVWETNKWFNISNINLILVTSCNHRPKAQMTCRAAIAWSQHGAHENSYCNHTMPL